MRNQSLKPYFAYRSFWKETDAMKQFAEIGVKQYCVFAGHSANSLGEPYSQYDSVWKWYDAYDFAPFDEQMHDVLAVCPEAEILCLVDLNSPLWLARQLYVDSFPQLSNALCEERWLAETEKYLLKFVEYAEEHYPQQIVCYILMCGTTDEWMDHANGTETPAKLARYRQWCVEQNLPVPADAPTVRERTDAPHDNHTFRDGAVNRNAVQYWRFHSELVVDSIIRFASQLRPKIAGGKQIGVFYGYILELETRATGCGHLAYEKLYQSNAVDFVISPGDYADREMGGGSGFMTPNGTVRLHGKNCLYEIDHRTHTANMHLTPYVELKWMKAWKNLDQDRAGLRREFCRALFHGSSLWWFDMWGKFFIDPENMAVIGRCKEIWDQWADASFEPEAEVALIVDPASNPLINENGPLSRPYRAVQNALNRLGTPHQIYSLNDIPKLPGAIKLVIFAAVVQLPPAAMAMLRKEVFGRRQCCWCGPCGLTDGETWHQLELPGVKFADQTQITAANLRCEAQKAGVHFYTDELCPVWAGRGLLSIHTTHTGPLKVYLKEPAGVITELFENKTVAKDCQTFVYRFTGPETVLFHLAKP